jgi:mycothiol synthase
VSPLGPTLPVSDGDVDAVTALVRRAEAAAGQDLIARATFEAARRGADGVGGFVSWSDDRTRALAYAQAARGDRRWELELAVDPEPAVVDDPPAAAREALRAALDVVRRSGGGPVHLWITRADPAHDRLAADLGLTATRDLWQVRRPLPVDEPWSLTTRPFVVGRDEEAWVEVNNRAFDWHPEQGGWTVEDVREREAEPWFDPAGFLIHEQDGEIAGFCWTKVHADHDPPLGEIYVIAVDPARHQRGLGRALVLAGLDHLARQGLTVGMLYVDADNTPATRLYDRLGFRLHHVDRAYTAEIPPG